MEGSQVVLPPGTWLDQTTLQGVSGGELGNLDTSDFEDNSIFVLEKPLGSRHGSSSAITEAVSPPKVSNPHPEQVVSSTQLSSTLLQAALFRAVATGNIASLKLMITAAKELGLLGNTGNPESISKIVNYDQRTLLHLASAEGHLDIVFFLLENRADPYAKDRWGATPLDDAWENGHMQVVEALESFLVGEQKSVNLEWRHRNIEHHSDVGYDIPLNTGHGPLYAFTSISLTDDFPFSSLRRAVSSPLDAETGNEQNQRERSVSCQEDDSFTFFADRFLPIDSPLVDREGYSDSNSPKPERIVGEHDSESLPERDVPDNCSEQEEESQLMKVAQEELDRAYRSEKDKIFQKYRKIIEDKLGSVPHRLRLLSLI